MSGGNTGARFGRAPRIFFSRAPEDAELVERIAAFLAPFPLPVSVTADAVVPGARWTAGIVEDVDAATHVFVFWSAHAERLPGVAGDADRALGAGKRVVLVRVDATPLPRHLAMARCLDARFVAGLNDGRYDAGVTGGYVREGKQLLTRLGVPIGQLLAEAPWPGQPPLRPDGVVETDPRLLAVALCAALR